LSGKSYQLQTGRPLGDHGAAQDAIDFLLDHRQAPGEETEFLRCWREGNLEEWPEYYAWLASRERRSALNPDGDTDA
jgi:hypothetical protein